MAVYLIESKADQQKLIDYVGEDIAKLFFALKNRLKSPENDIYYWLKKKPQELEDRLSELQNTQTRSQKDAEASEGAELIYNQDGWKVYHITTYEASKKYGKNTKWCITGSKYWNNGERGEEYFNDYTSEGIKFYFYIKDGTEKYALALVSGSGRYQIFNAEDKEITTEDLSFLPNVDGLPIFNIQTIADKYLEDGHTFRYSGQSFEEDQLHRIKSLIYEVIIEDGVTAIPNNFMYNATHLKNVILPVSVVEIGDGAFDGCWALEKIQLPPQINFIGDYAFSDCRSLRGNLVIPGTLKSTSNSMFYNTSIESLVLEEGIEYIGDSSFGHCRHLISVTLPSTLRVIDDGAFIFDGQLKNIKLPEGIEEIGDSVFADCYDLDEVNFPEGLKHIGAEAFGSTLLSSIDLPKSLQHVGRFAFADCQNLNDVYFSDNLINLNIKSVFYDSPITIYTDSKEVRDTLLDKYDDEFDINLIFN